MVMGKMLWKPSEEIVQQTNMFRFMNTVNERYGQQFTQYSELYQWSIDHIPDFWALLWEFVQIKASAPYTEVVDDPTRMPGAKWFAGTSLNFAENLLRYRDDRTALIFKGEGLPSTRTSYAQLYEEVARVAAALKAAGVKAGERVVGFIPNMPQAIVAMLAASIVAGALWDATGPAGTFLAGAAFTAIALAALPFARWRAMKAKKG